MSAGFELLGASLRYADGPAVLDADLTIVPGAHTALLGPSGCGKSTVLRLLAGLEAPSAGHVKLDDVTLSAPGRVLVPPHRRGVSMVFQDLALWPNLTAAQNVALGLGIAPDAAPVRDALTACEIGALSDRRPGVLSGGEQQRVALARAIAAEPAFLFLDEPFAGLDLITKETLLERITALRDARGFTVVLVSHDPDEVHALCDHAVVMDGGRVLARGTLTELLEDPPSELVRRFRR